MRITFQLDDSKFEEYFGDITKVTPEQVGEKTYIHVDYSYDTMRYPDSVFNINWTEFAKFVMTESERVKLECALYNLFINELATKCLNVTSSQYSGYTE